MTDDPFEILCSKCAHRNYELGRQEHEATLRRQGLI
jgi:hypothetical protein